MVRKSLALLLTDSDVRKLVKMRDVLEVVEQAFREKGLGKIQMPPKSYLHFQRFDSDYRAMPAYLELSNIAALKFVGAYPRNPSKGLPLVRGVVILIEPETGECSAIVDAAWLTALRTGASSGIATKFLSRPDSTSMGLLGAGMQARTQLEAICMVRKLEEIKVYDMDLRKASIFAQEQGKSLGMRVEAVGAAHEAAKGCDILVTTTPSTSPFLMNSWVGNGVHINAIGADAPGKQEVDEALIARAKIVVDDMEQAIHGGEINVPIAKGVLKRNQVYGELGQIVAGAKSGRVSGREITLFDSTGLGLHDAVVADLALRLAKKEGLGIEVQIG